MKSDMGSSILERIIDPGKDDLPPDVARYIRSLDFTSSDHDRVDDLSAKAHAGKLSDAETVELDQYILVNDLLTILQSKARRSLKQAGHAA